MDREEALSKFTREHRLELTDAKATREVVRKLRQDFINRNHLLSGHRFTVADIALQMIGTVIKARRTHTEDQILAVIKGIPFLLDEVPEPRVKEMIAMGKLGESPQLTKADLSRIREEDYLASLEQQLRSKATQDAERALAEERENLANLRQVVGEEVRALSALRSQLDSIPPQADLESMIQDEDSPSPEKPTVVWWKELGLQGDPFSSNRGLTGIPTTKYEEVVVPTPFVRSYISRLDQAEGDFIGKTLVILGEFGSGKTTLFQVLAQRATAKGILPVFTTLSPEPSVSRLTYQLTSQIYAEISRTFPGQSRRGIYDEEQPTDSIGLCLDLMQEVLSRNTTRGFLLLVDGLHKSESYQRQSLEFLQQIQTLQERIDGRRLACGILVAGSPAWETELKSNPSLSGSFYRYEKVPPLSEESAVEAVIRRIYSFVQPGRGSPTIIKAPLREAFQILGQRMLRPPTFRDYLDHVRDRFVAREYSNVGLSLALHTETIQKVQEAAKGSPLKVNYYNLVNPASHSHRFRTALRRILPEIYTRKGISEADPTFLQNQGVFHYLRQEGFIVSRSSADRRTLTWYLSKPVVDLLQTVYDRDKVVAHEALEALFSDSIKEFPRETETIYRPLRQLLAERIAAWRSGWPEVAALLEKAASQVADLERVAKSSSGMMSTDSIDLLRQSLANLVRAVLFAAGSSDNPISANIQDFATVWCAPENAESILQSLAEWGAASPKSETKFYGRFLAHAQFSGDLCQLLTNLVRGEAVSRLRGRRLTADDFIKIHDARIELLSQQYATTVDGLCELFEKKIRDIIYLAMRCAAGPSYDLWIPSDIKSKLGAPIRGHHRAQRLSDRNFLFDISRSEYSKVIFQRPLRQLFFGPDATDDDLASLKNSFELLFSIGDRLSHRDRPSYFRDHATEIGDALKAAPRMCESLNSLLAKLVAGDGFAFRKAEGTEAVVTFGPSQAGFREIRVPKVDLDNEAFEVLSLLDGDVIRVPPVDRFLGAQQVCPEVTLAALRACHVRGYAKYDGEPRVGTHKWTITAEGLKRLAALRQSRQRTPE